MKRTNPKYAKHLNGFTLLEILIAILILATVLSTVFASYTGTFRIVGETESQAEIYQMARIAFERIIEDLECYYVPQKVGTTESTDAEKSLEFAGEENEIQGRSADTLRFPSRAHLVFGDQGESWGIAEISYYVEEGSEGEGLVLYRSDRLHLEPTSEEDGGGLPLCERLLSVDFTYYDAEGEEYKSWDPSSEEEEGAPQLVSISLEFINPSDPEIPLKFATRATLPVSEAKAEEE
jgi:prepilin-type N-terminal cleavage/methylation domain-containing protein